MSFKWVMGVKAFQWQISASKYVFIISMMNMALYHVPLFTFAAKNVNGFSLHTVSIFFTLFFIIYSFTAVFLFILGILSPFLLKFFSIMTVIGNSIALYFMNTYNVILDKSMMANAFNTRSVESISYLHPKLLIYIFIFGLIPCWFLYKTKIVKINRLRLLFTGMITLIAALLIIYINASTSLWFDQNARRLGGRILPWSYMGNSIRHGMEQSNNAKEVTLLPSASLKDDKKTLVVLVIGETARSNNFSMYGYDKETNPLLKESGAVALNNASACSTYTTASIYCMLSHNGATSGFVEPLPSYLQRHGVKVIWRSNNWGEPPIKVSKLQKANDLKAECIGVDCNYDGVLLSNLREEIEASDANKMFLVLHTTGSHGPAYNTKYPKEFEKFAPVCESVELDNCSSEELINAYDNTIVYTDYFLSETIKTLKTLKDIPVTMMYVSDHGESLGEYGLYLHGTPYSIAPDYQKEIPFIVWMSDSFKNLKDLNKHSFKQNGNYSHHNVFHSVMGALGVNSSIYKEGLDIFNVK